jgi:hypothetical protein
MANIPRYTVSRKLLEAIVNDRADLGWIFASDIRKSRSNAKQLSDTTSDFFSGVRINYYLAGSHPTTQRARDTFISALAGFMADHFGLCIEKCLDSMLNIC